MADKKIQVEIYRDTAPFTLVDILPARISPQVLSELQNHGAGSFKIHKRDAKILADPTLLAYRNFVRIRVNDLVVGGFIIKTKKTVIVGEGEVADEAWEVSGGGLRSWFEDASVYPARGLQRSSKETRYFNFASEVGAWYNPSAWVEATKVQKWNSGGWWNSAPTDWPDAPNAWWIWDRSSPYEFPKGTVYFRYTFTVTSAGSHSVFFAVDDLAELYVDGEKLAESSLHAWQESHRVDFTLEAGEHVIAFKALNSYITGGPAGLIAAIFRFGDPLVPSSAQLIAQTGDPGWKILPYPGQEPGWTPGAILRTLIEEAKSRGVRFASNITYGFSDTLDSAGNAWDQKAWSFDIGATSYSDVVEALEETDCDIYLNPDTLVLQAWKRRGSDLSKTSGSPNPVVFQPGHNLLAADETGQADIANRILLRSADGWTLQTPSTADSVNQYGVIENQLSTDMSESSATSLMAELFRQKALPEKSATFVIRPVDGMRPFVDFNVGDFVSAPNSDGVLESRRVVSISVTENDKTGESEYSLEFDNIFKDRQDELERRLSRSTGSSSMGGSFAGSSDLPTTVITLPPATIPIVRTPDAPTWVQVTTSAAWDALGSPRAEISFQWTPVVTSGQATISDVIGYELWGRKSTETEERLFYTVEDTYAQITALDPGVQWKFRVRALSRTSGVGVFSDEYTVTTATSVPPLGKPSPPTLASSLGAVVISWDGLLGGASAPAHYKQMIVERSTAASGQPWVRVATLTNVSGQDNSATVGSTYFYRLVPLDNLNNPGPASDPASITVKGVEVGQVGTGVINTDNIAANAVTVTKLASGAVERDKLATGAVGTNELANAVLTAQKFNTKQHIIF